MDFSRRSFIGGALSFGALAGCRAFRAPVGLFSGDGANLILGVISDIHVDCGRGDFKKFGDSAQFEKTLHWFDEQGVEGVVVAGDMADNGMINQLECVGEAWFRVFPAGRSTIDSRPVEQLFVYGNHDLEGQNYDQFAFRYFEKESFAEGQIRRDPAEAWEHVFHEKYQPIWLKEVKGYQFVGAQWTRNKNAWDGIPEVEPWFRENAAKIDRTKPFFFVQHCHPQDTVYGKDAWCADKGYATHALSEFPNAIAFSGHSHTSLTDERSIWQGAFTSVATSSLRYGGNINRWQQRQGLLVKVYDDRVVFVRRDFVNDASLGDDWVLPLPNGTAKPLSFDVRKAASEPPKFASGAKLVVRPDSQQVSDKNGTRSVEGWTIEIPCADAGRTRAFQYRIDTSVRQADGKPIERVVCDAMYNMPRKMAGVVTKAFFAQNKFPKDAQPKFVVYPIDSFGNAGEPLKA